MNSIDNEKLAAGMDLVDDMTTEELDALVDYIRTVFKTKRQGDAARMRAQLSKGDRVQIVGPTKPQYLSGLTGVVTEKRQTRIAIKLDRGPVGKFRSGTVVCPPQMLRKVED
jgi:preprotein translocase subunit YajC